MCTNLPERLTEELSGRLPPLAFAQAVVQQVRVDAHGARLVAHAVDQVVGVDVVLDEGVQGNL